MKEIIDKELLNKIIQINGRDAQIEMIQEECIELALALQKCKRKDINDIDKLISVYDEIADVIIMIEQAKILFNQDIINKRIRYKLNRMKRIIIENNENC